MQIHGRETGCPDWQEGGGGGVGVGVALGVGVGVGVGVSVGVGLGVLGLVTLGASPGIRGFIEPDINPKLMLISVAIAVFVGVISGLYPAWRSSRLTPSLAMQG